MLGIKVIFTVKAENIQAQQYLITHPSLGLELRLELTLREGWVSSLPETGIDPGTLGISRWRCAPLTIESLA